MARITVEDCIDKFESRFELVLVASNRARKLHSGDAPTVEKDNDKNTVIALREIADETIPIDSMINSLVEEYQTVSPQIEEDLSIEKNEIYDDNDDESSDILKNEEISNENNTNLDSVSENDNYNDENDIHEENDNHENEGNTVDENNLNSENRTEDTN